MPEVYGAACTFVGTVPSISSLAFSTERLAVSPLAETEISSGPLIELAGALLQPAVLIHLPPGWSDEPPEQWLRARQAESTVLVVGASDRGAPIGLVLLTLDEGRPSLTIRLGYLLREDSWGRGYASELLVGLVAEICKAYPEGGSLLGGVSKVNPASGRVLVKAGFELAEENASEQFFRLTWGAVRLS